MGLCTAFVLLVALVGLFGVPAATAGDHRRDEPEHHGSDERAMEYAVRIADRERRSLVRGWPSLLSNVSAEEPPPTSVGYGSAEPSAEAAIGWMHFPEHSRRQMRGVLLDAVQQTKRLVVAAVGGSATAGRKAASWESSYPAVYAELLGKALRGVEVEYINGARGGTGSGVVPFCLETLVGPQVDILIIEFSLNDAAMYHTLETPEVSYEQLLRRSMTLHPSAVVICVGLWATNLKPNPYYHLHRQVASHYGAAWVAADPMKDWLLASGVAREVIAADSTGHPTNGTHSMLAKVMFVNSIRNGFHEHRQTTRHLPAPIHSALLREDLAITAHCDLVGAPRFHEPHDGLLANAVTSNGWYYVLKSLKDSEKWMDKAVYLLPLRDADEFHKMCDSPALSLLHPPPSQQDGPLTVRTTVTDGRILLSASPYGGYYVMFARMKCDFSKCPFRLYYANSNVQIPMKPWLDMSYGIWESSVPVRKGEHLLRIEAEDLGYCQFFPALGAVIGY